MIKTNRKEHFYTSFEEFWGLQAEEMVKFGPYKKIAPPLSDFTSLEAGI